MANGARTGSDDPIEASNPDISKCGALLSFTSLRNCGDQCAVGRHGAIGIDELDLLLVDLDKEAFPIYRPEHLARFAEGLRQAGLPE